jgi:hypothetical protein
MYLRIVLWAAALLLSPCARADIIVDWNQQANVAMAAEGGGTSGNPIVMARSLAMMHVAMFDAIDACNPAYQHYLRSLAPAPGASPQAAAHAAAHAVLVALFPNQRSTVDAYYASAVSALPVEPGNAAGIALGEQAAQMIVKARKDDGTFGVADSYRPTTSPGAYVPTVLPVVSNIASRLPFALQSTSQFRPGPPPALSSALWARDFNETREWGAVNSQRRTPRQTETARFWEQLGTPAWNQIARGLSEKQAMPLAERARMFAQLNIAMFDAYLAVFEAKYHYHFWRPVTAIRNGDQDGNEATERDATWRPLLDTPPHPEYPCAHCTADGAAGAVLTSAFGKAPAIPFTVSYLAMPKVTREYNSVRQVQDEVSLARIWGGVHFRNSNQTGDILGEKIGDYILKTTFISAGDKR